MNLEAVEQKCLSYLRQARNPLVPVDTLLAHLHQDEACTGVTKMELVDFLRKHELFRLMESPMSGEEVFGGALASAGLNPGPYAILDTRVPTAREVQELMRQELSSLQAALEQALDESMRAGDTERGRQVMEVLKRARELQDRVGGSP